MAENRIYTKGKFFMNYPRLAIIFICGVILSIVAGVLLKGTTFFIVVSMASFLTYFAIITFVVSIIYMRVNAKTKVRLEQEAQEEERLAEIKATMTPAEWEAYKLQMENNRLLKNIQKRGNSTQTTTTFGFTE